MKKLIAFLLVVATLFVFVACAKIPSDPEELAKKLQEEYGENVEVLVYRSEGEIDEMAKDFGISDEGLRAILVIELENPETLEEKWAFVFYCEKSSQAKEVEEDCLDKLVGAEFADLGYVVERSGKAVFIGEEEIFEKIK